MYHSILVPLDGSPFAEQALPLALSIANRARARLEVMLVHVLYMFQQPECSWLPFDPTEDAIFKSREQAYLDAIVKRLRKTASVPVTSALASGTIEDGILERARTEPADLIVMTTHGRSPLKRFWLGSVALDVVLNAPVPVLLVRPQQASADSGPEPTLRRILVPLDGSKFAEGVLEPTVALGSLMDAEYTLVRAVEPGLLPDGFRVVAELSATEQPRLEKRKAEAQAYLDGVAGFWRSEALRIQTQVVVGTSAAAVLGVARDKKSELIAIAIHGRGAFKRLLLGSVAGKIVRGTSTPVLVYRPMTGG
ncbi:MAG: universal stress protein [Thermoguttaceae bacterium]|jgi:nucleotide-binding universal stress UspA family protein